MMLRITTIAFVFTLAASAAFGQTYIKDIARDSARTDIRTGGVIEKATMMRGAGNVRVTINLPSFDMTLWQNDKEIGYYKVGIGKADYPVAVSLRQATSIDWNPVWIPPSSDWIEKSSTVKAGEIVEPTDPRNPLGKVKIPLGYGYLIHQAKGIGDLGNLVSHGCIRVMQRDLYDMSEKVISALGLPMKPAEIAHAKRTKIKISQPLDPSMLVEISYDTMVVEKGVLSIYPDIYSYKKNTVENLRKELESNGVDDSRFTNAHLRRMIGFAVGKRKYTISVANLKAGKVLGRTLPVLS